MTAGATYATQAWMLRVVTHPEGVDAGFAAARDEGLLPDGVTAPEEVVLPGRMTAAERLHVYGYAYFARLLDILEADHPTVDHLLGDRARETFKAFLVERPSTSYTLGHLSRGLPDWLRARGLALEADVAAVERALDEVIDRPAEPAIPHADLAAVPRDRWADLRLRPSSSLLLFPLRFPVNALISAVRDDEPVVRAEPAGAPLWGCVHRQVFTPWRREIDGLQHALLATLVEGGTLGDALGAALEVPGADAQELLGSLGAWFEEWMGDGMFVAL